VLESIVMLVETGSAVSLICGILSLSDVVGDMAFFGGEGGVCDSQSTLGKAMVVNDEEGVDVVDDGVGAGVRDVSCLNKSSFMEADRFVLFMIYWLGLDRFEVEDILAHPALVVDMNDVLFEAGFVVVPPPPLLLARIAS